MIKGVYTKKKLFLLCSFFCLLIVSISVSFDFFILQNPKNSLLIKRNGAQWIFYNTPFQLKLQPSKHLTIYFRKSFQLSQNVENLYFKFTAMKNVKIGIDDKQIFSSDSSLSYNWKDELSLKFPNDLEIGNHLLTVAVSNTFGPPAFMGYCEQISLKTNDKWEASIDGLNWVSAITADVYRSPNDCAYESSNELSLPERFIRADKVFLQHLIFILIFIMGSIVLYCLYDRNNNKIIQTPFLTVNRISILLWLLWAGLSFNNISKLHLLQGMDAKAHYEYILYFANNWRQPLAHDGWQMFQSPLYYFVSALLYKFLLIFTTPETSFYLLRIIPLISGALQIEICRRMVRYVFPDRNDLQIIGVVIGSLLPMNIYISQYVGNEPLCALFTSIAILQALIYITTYPQSSKKVCVYIGIFVGLAILTKVTAILLVPVIVLLFFWKSFNTETHIIKNPNLFIGNCIIFLGVVISISGWYYLCNFFEMGHFFIGGWDNSRAIQWWQNPGYRTPEQFMTFGYSLIYPVYSGVIGLWDSLYSTLWMDGFLSGACSISSRPHWNYNFLFVTIWLSLVLTISGILSFVLNIQKIWSENNELLIFCIMCLSIYCTAISYLYLNVPIYSTAKSSYMLGLTGCIAVLCTDGLRYFMVTKILGLIIYLFVGCWAFYSYIGYFIH